MIDKIAKELCTGCNACYNTCPQKCIEMVADEMGFWYPKVDSRKCIECGGCIKVCPSYNRLIQNEDNIETKVYAAWTLDEKIRMESTSGGIFSELARKIIEEKGIVVGAQYKKNHLVEHSMIENKEAIKKLRQSKYVQSDINDIFVKVKKKLDEYKIVAFCGSPCQVAGLLTYLNKPYDNLVTFDFICRGINSPKAYTKYLEFIEKKYKSKVKKIWFKNKSYGWNRFSTKIDLENGKTYIKDRYNDLYMRGYIEENLYMRPCCFKCKYKSGQGMSDITLGDFWRIGESDINLDANKGTSLVMINTKKGEQLFSSIKENIFCQASNMETAIVGNISIIKSAKKNLKSEIFLEMLDEYSFDVCFRKCVKNSGIKRVRNNLLEIKRQIKCTQKGNKCIK